MLVLLLLACRITAADVDAALDPDGDEFGPRRDCAPRDGAVYPGAEETWYDGVDQSCSGNDFDQDGDGFASAIVPNRDGVLGEDCDDFDGAVNPGVDEVWYDGVDQNCDGGDDFDQDGDGFQSANDEQADGAVGDDCVDGSENDEIFTDSCSGELITVEPADAASINPNATDAFYDGVDQNCDGADDNDADGDGYPICDECDDTDPQIFPEELAEEWYDCIDQDCDGNDGDRDRDGYVDAAYTDSCADWATINPGKKEGDCWDNIMFDDPNYSAINGNPKLSQAAVHPDAEDIPYDAVDAACDGDKYEFDADRDYYETDAEPNRSGAVGDDCHDDVAAAHPGAVETCDTDGIDHDCDGYINEPNARGCLTFYTDADMDGYGTFSSQCLCEAEGTYTANEDADCDDTNKNANPAGTEARDAVDNNCDGLCDEGLLSYGDLVITELMQDPKTLKDHEAEWFELYNASGADILMCGGWFFYDNGSDVHTLARNIFIPAGEHALFLRDDDTGKNGGLTGNYTYGSDIDLGNIADELYIEFDGLIIDELEYDISSQDWISAMTSGYSMQLNASLYGALDNDDSLNWSKGTSSYHTDNRGTPGAQNDHF